MAALYIFKKMRFLNLFIFSSFKICLSSFFLSFTLISIVFCLHLYFTLFYLFIFILDGWRLNLKKVLYGEKYKTYGILNLKFFFFFFFFVKNVFVEISLCVLCFVFLFIYLLILFFFGFKNASLKGWVGKLNCS